MKKILTGKVRDLYETNDNNLVIVTTDRISAFDVVLANDIPQKGVVLNKISNFWFDYTKSIIPNHIISTSIDDMPKEMSENVEYYKGRTVLVRKLNMLPYEFIVRGYMFGNMWKAYANNGVFCGQSIVEEYQLAEKLKTPIITPSVKINDGHDEYITIEQLVNDLGNEEVKKICDICLELYNKCFEYAFERGIIIADTKFEFGYDEYGVLRIGDEMFTPDSSRFWNVDQYKTGHSPSSYDKQFVRDWLIDNKLDGILPGPKLPDDIVEATKNLYIECQDKLVR